MTDQTQPGDWVRIWAQVSGVDSKPEDTSVVLTSTVEQYIAHVRTDMVVKAARPPGFAPPCRTLKAMMVGEGIEAWMPCVVGWDQHPGKHRDATGREWDDDHVTAYRGDA